MSNIPATWLATILGDVCEVVRGITFPASAKESSPRPDNVCCLRTTNIQREIDWSSVYFVPRFFVKRDDQFVVPGDILMSMANSYELVGKVAVARNVRYPTAFGAFLSAVRPRDGIDGQYLFHLLRTGQVQGDLRKGSSQTVNIANISAKTLSKIVVPLAPRNEQKRIADKLDAVLARVDACRERLDRFPAILARFRQAVLAAATSGRLTEEWRDSNGRRPGWREVKLSEVSIARLGKMLDNVKNEGVPTPYLRNINVRWFRFDLGDIQRIRVTLKEASELALNSGDVLVCEGGEPGRCAIWREAGSTFVYQKALHRVRVGANLTPEWLCYSLKDAADNGRLAELFTGTTIKHLTGVALGQFALLLPPLDEQHEIARRVETLFAYADRLEARYTAARALVERLTPALLAKAFRGDLVPQDPRDEPASLLLERIRVARAGEPDNPRRIIGVRRSERLGKSEIAMLNRKDIGQGGSRWEEQRNVDGSAQG